GEGINISSLVGRNLATAQLVMGFNSAVFDMYGFRFEGMTITRLTPGAVFSFLPLASVPEDTSMFCAEFRNLYFLSPDPFMGPYNSFSPLVLKQVKDSVFSNVQAEGGESALRMVNCARCTFTNFVVGPRSAFSQSGIVIYSGGGHIFENTRIGPVGSPTYK